MLCGFQHVPVVEGGPVALPATYLVCWKLINGFQLNFLLMDSVMKFRLVLLTTGIMILILYNIELFMVF
jgi:hypothetical protein